jgi:hypothetical protein
MNEYKIRFNQTRGQPGRGTSEHAWRVFENGREYICKNVTINVPCKGVTDEDGLHWNIVCHGYMMIDKLNSNVIITDKPSDMQGCHLI